MVCRGGSHFNQYRDKYKELFGEDIESPDKANEELNAYVGYNIGFKPITDNLDESTKSSHIKSNLQLLGKEKLLDNNSHEKLISALIKELENHPGGFVYNGLHDLVRRKTKTKGSSSTRGGYQIKIANHKFVLLLTQKSNRTNDGFKLYYRDGDKLEQIGLNTLKGSTYLQDALALAQSHV
jgi:hypothetical protein